MRKRLLIIFSALLVTGCSDEEKKAEGIPTQEDFELWFQRFVDFFTPNDLTNKERIVFVLLILIIISSVLALINSSRALNFFKETHFQNRFLSILLLRPTFLKFPFKAIKHHGWALGTWVFLRYLIIIFLFVLICVLVMFLVTNFFYLTMIITFLLGYLLFLIAIR